MSETPRHPLVSVITPVYNAERWVAQTIQSVRAQTVTDWEMLIVDDGSTDRSVETIRPYLADPRLRLITQANHGPSYARNTGVDASRGAYLQFLDADDLLAPDKFEQQLRRLCTAPPRKPGGALYAASCAWARFDDGAGLAQLDERPDALWRDLEPVEWLVTALRDGLMMASAAWLVPRRLAQLAGPWAAYRSPNDDGEFFARCILNSDGVLFTGETRVYYRSNILTSWCRARTPEAVEGLLNSMRSIERHLLNADLSAETCHALATVWQRYIYDLYPQHRPFVEYAQRRVEALGGTHVQPPDGGVFGRVSRVAGWKTARWMQYLRDEIKHRAQPVAGHRARAHRRTGTAQALRAHSGDTWAPPPQ